MGLVAGVYKDIIVPTPTSVKVELGGLAIKSWSETELCELPEYEIETPIQYGTECGIESQIQSHIPFEWETEFETGTNFCVVSSVPAC